ALAKLAVLLALQNDPILIAGALINNYLDVYRMFITKKSHRAAADAAKAFGYTGRWNYRLGNAETTAARFDRPRMDASMKILQKLDLDLKSSRLDAELLLQKALCELAAAGRRA
ncbi:MAG: DNA polymerase III subunit delta, partial [Gemmiger sp.]|nr:DNA polymerase III subunit delta [Gemmiger sp.]